MFGDARWWKKHHETVIASGFAGKIATTSAPQMGCTPERLLYLKQRKPVPPLSPGCDEGAMDKTSLHLAIDIAVKRGAGTIVLLGADMHTVPGKPTHHHTPHPPEWSRHPKPQRYVNQMGQLRTLAGPLQARGIKVFNCSPSSLIDWWEKADFNELTKVD